ncbi:MULTISPECIES: Rib/alpha-like domain-containing protein, partial [Terrabacteria group]
TDSVDPKYAQDTVVKAGESGTVVAPKDADGNALPEGTKFVPGKDVPEWAKVNPDGSITVAPGKDVVPGDYKVPVVVTYPDGSTDAVEVPVKVTEGGKGRTDAGKPAWDDASTPADKTVVIPNKGGDVVEGTTVEVEGPGKAEIGADGSLKVTPSADAKPGDKIVAKVKDGEGNVIDTVTV